MCTHEYGEIIIYGENFKKRQSSRAPAVGWAELEWGASVLGKHLWAPPSHKHEMFIHGLDFWKHTLWWMLTFTLPFEFKWKYSECHGQASQWSELLPRMPVAKLGCKRQTPIQAGEERFTALSVHGICISGHFYLSCLMFRL